MNLPRIIWIFAAIWDVIRTLLLFLILILGNIVYGSLAPVVLAALAAPQVALSAGTIFQGLQPSLPPSTGQPGSGWLKKTGSFFFPIFFIGKLCTTAALGVVILLWIQGLHSGMIIAGSESGPFLLRSLGLLFIDLIVLATLSILILQNKQKRHAGG
jgi:hypothetical protein